MFYRRLSRRQLLAAIATTMVLAGAGFGYRSFTATRIAALRRVEGRSEVIDTRFGALEYAVAGEGAAVLMIHGTGGGFDQALSFSTALLARGHRIVAPSRFGYLRSAFPNDPSAANQADALVELIDHLGIERLAVVGGSAGALPAAAFALRHPDRCSALILAVPAANVSGSDPVELSPFMEWTVRQLLASDVLFWIALRTAPKQLIRTLLATDPALLETVSAAERRRAYAILEELMPISLRARGMLADALKAGSPTDLDVSRLRVPTLILSAEDDRFGTAETSRQIAAMVPTAALRIFSTGGHIWLGHDEDVADEIARFVS